MDKLRSAANHEAEAGMVYYLTPKTDRARNWVNDNVRVSDWQRVGESMVIERRFVTDIVTAMIERGFKVYEDFDLQPKKRKV